MTMSPATQVLLSGALTVGVPVALAILDLRAMRRGGGSGGTRSQPPAPPKPRPLPDCLIPKLPPRPAPTEPVRTRTPELV
jgi:hypothetical protein